MRRNNRNNNRRTVKKSKRRTTRKSKTKRSKGSRLRRQSQRGGMPSLCEPPSYTEDMRDSCNPIKDERECKNSLSLE